MLRDMVEARPAGEYKLYLRFEDGVEGEIDLSNLVEFKGVFAPLRDVREAAKVRVDAEHGTVSWPNGAGSKSSRCWAFNSCSRRRVLQSVTRLRMPGPGGRAAAANRSPSRSRPGRPTSWAASRGHPRPPRGSPAVRPTP